MRNVFYFLLALVMLGASCQSKKDSKSDEASEFDQQAKEITQKMQSTVPTFPPPDEFAAKLNATGADYFDNIINDPAKADQYVGAEEIKAAANLGVYFADLAYTSSYQQRDESMKVLDAIIKLSNRLGIERGIMLVVAERYNDYVEVPDSVKAYIREMSEKVNDNLKIMGRERLVAIAYAGLYVEALNMGVGIVTNYPDDLPKEMRQQLLIPVYQFVLGQKDDISKVRDYLDNYIEGVQETPYYDNLMKLEKLYGEIDYDKILETQDLSLIESDPKIKELADTIREMRANVVK